MNGWTCIFLIAVLISLTTCATRDNDNSRIVAIEKQKTIQTCNELKKLALLADPQLEVKCSQ